MKIFRGILIVFYGFIVVGGIANYSTQYNGQPVFSLIGIFDNFIVSAILPLAIYGIGLFIRKIFFNKYQFSYMKKPEANTEAGTEKIESRKSIRAWHIILAIIVGLAIIQIDILRSNNSGSGTTTSSSSAGSATIMQDYDDSWIPSDFSGYPDNDNVAWRWGTGSETNCTYSTGACWSVVLITRDGCPSGMYAELAILDSSGVQIDFTNDSTTRVLPKTKVKLTFDTFNEEADTARLSEVSCR